MARLISAMLGNFIFFSDLLFFSFSNFSLFVILGESGRD